MSAGAWLLLVLLVLDVSNRMWDLIERTRHEIHVVLRYESPTRKRVSKK